WRRMTGQARSPARCNDEGFSPNEKEIVAMTMAKILIGSVGLAALAGAASPAAAQYYPYGNAYGYGNGMSTQAAVDRCTEAVQARISFPTSNYNGYYGGYSSGRVLNVTSVDPNRYSVRVRGLATSGRMASN